MAPDEHPHAVPPPAPAEDAAAPASDRPAETPEAAAAGPLSDAERQPASGPGASSDMTWDPAKLDPFTDDVLWNVALDQLSQVGQSTAGGTTGAATDPVRRETPVPVDTKEVQAIWRADFDSLTPSMTLKGPDSLLHNRPSGVAPPAVPVPAGSSALRGYDLLRVIGEGGVGVVYQAVQKSLGRNIAVKMIRGGTSAGPREKAKFLTEAVVTGKLDHPNIVPVHDLGTSKDGLPFYTMKLVRGTPWHEVIRTKTLAENLRILVDVCDAVSFAHSKGVIHRDLKPENVMLGEFGEVQVMDWGLGVSVGEDGLAAGLTPTQAAGGTPAYMAPEMVTGDDGPIGIHSDIYLLGAILYEIVTRRPPHPGRRVMDCLQNARKNVIGPAAAGGSQDRSAPDGGVLLETALRALRTDPAERYPSVQAFKSALLDYQAHAQSIDLCQRSSEHLLRACAAQDYDAFAEAMFGFREALKLWNDNFEARAGLAESHLQYARCAFEKGDLDLAASLLDPQRPEQRSLAAEIDLARRRRDATKRRVRLLRNTALGLTAAIVVTLTVASIWIAAAKHQAEVAREAAVAAQLAEAEQRRLAEAARARAVEEEARAVQALADLEKAVKAVVEARTQEERAVAQAQAAELVAAETRDELAKTGMLLDNSWWVFNAQEARRRQEAAAATVGLPVELAIKLPADRTLEMVLIPPGEFVMGSAPQEEQRAADEYLHRVQLARPFYLGRYELTEGQWEAVTGQPPPQVKDRPPDGTLPVGSASFEQIRDNLLPALQRYAPSGYQFRLPTEAEWEYACRAGTASAYHTGDGVAALDAAGWFLSNSERRVHPVGGKAPNAFGLFDLHGNVGELCADEHVVGYYLESPVEQPFSQPADERPVVRGGSILNTPEHCRAAYRSYAYRRNRYEFVGVRLALVPVHSANP